MSSSVIASTSSATARDIAYPIDVVRALAANDHRLEAPFMHAIEAIARGNILTPLLPAVALALLEMTRDGDVDFGRMAKTAMADPAVAARIVRLGSSVLQGSPPPSGVREALVRIGLDGVRHVAFDVAFSSRVLRRGPTWHWSSAP